VLLRLVYLSVTNVFALLRLLPASDRDEDAEILVLRHQITILQRQLGTTRPRLSRSDRAFLAALLHRLPRDVLGQIRLLVRPEMVLRSGTGTCWRAGTRPGLVPGARDGRAPSAPSGCWCCAWPGRTLLMWSWGLCGVWRLIR
jgi:hypothetical protein